ncbi:hypothetical protein HK102_007912 [Quaeritorhiza haematococci]|nr:hypothetical protein HK102_007912 [Quaeritorhiza haematococci]
MILYSESPTPQEKTNHPPPAPTTTLQSLLNTLQLDTTLLDSPLATPSLLSSPSSTTSSLSHISTTYTSGMNQHHQRQQQYLPDHLTASTCIEEFATAGFVATLAPQPLPEPLPSHQQQQQQYLTSYIAQQPQHQHMLQIPPPLVSAPTPTPTSPLDPPPGFTSFSSLPWPQPTLQQPQHICIPHHQLQPTISAMPTLHDQLQQQRDLEHLQNLHRLQQLQQLQLLQQQQQQLQMLQQFPVTTHAVLPPPGFNMGGYAGAGAGAGVGVQGVFMGVGVPSIAVVGDVYMQIC